MGETTTCYHCQRVIDKQSGIEVNNQIVCPDCINELYYRCDDCGEYFLTTDDFIETENQTIVCSKCSSNYFQCNECNKWFEKDNRYRGADDNYYCETHFYRLFCYCDNCSEPVYQDDSYYLEGSDRTLCQYCYENRDEDEESNNYSQKRYSPPENITFEELPYTRTIGIELESSTKDFSFFEGYFNQVSDGSISGWEYTSPILQGDEAIRIIKQFCSDAVNHGIQTDTACGYHLHLGSKDISFRKLRNILLVYKYFEPVIYSMIAQSRKTSNWCKSIEFSVEQIVNCKSEKELQILYYSFNPDVKKKYIQSFCRHKYQSQRYSGCNLHSHWFRKTIELRYHSGTLNSTKVLNWVKLHQILFAYALSHKTKTLIKLFNYSNRLEKINHIINQSLLKQDDKQQLISYIAERIEHFNPAPIPESMPTPEETVIPEEIETREPALVFFNA